MREKEYIYFGDGQREKKFSKNYHWSIIGLTACVTWIFMPDFNQVGIEVAYALISVAFFNSLLTYLHEYIHKWTATLFGYKTHVEFRWSWMSLDGVCHFDKGEYIKRNHFLITLVTPFFTLITLLMSALWIIEDSIALYTLVCLLILLKGGGCMTDFYMVSEAFRKTTKGDKLRYTGDSTFEILN